MCEARIPVRFWIDGESQGHLGETLGIAPWHLNVATTMELFDGMRLTVKLRLATGEGRDEFSERELFGWVVGVSQLGEGKCGAQIELERD